MYQSPPGQQNSNQYVSGDVESHAVNVTPIPVAQETTTSNDLDVMWVGDCLVAALYMTKLLACYMYADVFPLPFWIPTNHELIILFSLIIISMLDIIPGVYQVQSAYHIDEVNAYSQKIIRYAIGLCAFNVLIAILISSVDGGDTSTVVDAVVAIVFNVLVLFLAVKCVRSKNAICCCGLSALTFYRYFLMVNIFFIVIAMIVQIGWISRGYFWSIAGLIYNLILFFFNCNQLRYSNKVMKALTVQIQPHNPGSNPGVTRPVPGNRALATATPTTAVVQSTPSFAQAEIDTSNHGQGNRDPNAYG